MLLTQILKRGEHFSNIDNIIASYILEKGEELNTETVRSIAENTYVSPATVMRFFKDWAITDIAHSKRTFWRR
ncbi:hypothetical protein MKD05_15275 [[Clostridium] innocuum]|nr:hypothetical protein [[Clostridium] innocuum]